MLPNGIARREWVYSMIQKHTRVNFVKTQNCVGVRAIFLCPCVWSRKIENFTLFHHNMEILFVVSERTPSLSWTVRPFVIRQGCVLSVFNSLLNLVRYPTTSYSMIKSRQPLENIHPLETLFKQFQILFANKNVGGGLVNLLLESK